ARCAARYEAARSEIRFASYAARTLRRTNSHSDNLAFHSLAAVAAMFAYQLAQLATLVAAQGQSIMSSRTRLPDPALDVYWTASKCRQDRWSRTLRTLAVAPATRLPYRCEESLRVKAESVLEEVLVTETLTRVWAAICQGLDRRRGRDEASPIAGSVLAGHFEARNRVLNLMVYGYGIGVEDAVELNRCRLRVERWTDMLLAFLSHSDDVTSYAFDMARVREWARIVGVGVAVEHGKPFPPLTAATLAGVPRDSRHLPTTANEDLNQRIACSILGCLPVNLFESTGTPLSALRRSLTCVVPDSQGKIHLSTPAVPPAAIPDTGGWFNRRKGI
ncbi:MAG: hypothetical protein AB7F89_18010, partial [Pirellulaceae bacterium]